MYEFKLVLGSMEYIEEAPVVVSHMEGQVLVVSQGRQRWYMGGTFGLIPLTGATRYNT
jgi:hypothetical protein